MKVRSARGEMVDFALLEMKSRMVNTVPTNEVVARKKKIEKGAVYVDEPVETEDVTPDKTDDGVVNKRKVRNK